jgi:hypothetical protein
VALQDKGQFTDAKAQKKTCQLNVFKYQNVTKIYNELETFWILNQNPLGSLSTNFFVILLSASQDLGEFSGALKNMAFMKDFRNLVVVSQTGAVGEQVKNLPG